LGDIKTGIQGIDHNGWYLLDGRSVSDLPGNAKTAAIALGIVDNLPNASDKFLKQTGPNESLLSSRGANQITINQSNLPDVNFSGSSSVGGNHAHSGSTSTTGNHSHSGVANTAGAHNHDFYTANHDINDATSQGYPSNNNHVALRTTDRRQRTEDRGVIRTEGNHTHNLNINNAGNHSHLVSIASNGNHSHTVNVPSGGSGTPIDIQPSYLTVNTFMYLGE
ncbi:MAG: hypothetical protein AAGK97_10145, partial [Bacteroidota bacterium]